MLKKAAILVASVLIVSALWFAGMEILYSRVLAFSSNVVLHFGGRESRVAVEKHDDEHVFFVDTIIEGRQARFPQRIQSLLYPTIMVIAWQLFIAFTRGWKQSLGSGKWNIGLFFVFQVLFLLLLTAYHSSATAKFIYDMLMESFYVIAVVIIIIDNIRHPSLFLQNKAS